MPSTISGSKAFLKKVWQTFVGHMLQLKCSVHFQKNFHVKGLGALDVQEGTTFQNIFFLK